MSTASQKMKIAYLTSQYARAGDTFIRREVGELRRRGHTVSTFSIRRAKDENIGPEIQAEQDATDYILERGFAQLARSLVGWAVKRPDRALEAMRVAWKTRPPGVTESAKQLVYLAEAAYLATRLRDLEIDHLHNHIPENSGTVAMLASILSEVPHSHTVHGPRFFFSPEKWGIDEKLARAAFIACITSFCRSQVMIFTEPEHWPKLKQVHCGLDPSFLNVTPAPIPADPRLIAVGRLCPEKGFLLLLDAMKILADEGIDGTVDIIGGGPSKAEIEARVAALGLEGRIRLLGWKTSDEVRAHIQQARGLINPSFAEGLPVVLMEAFALARPVISTYIAGVPELVRPGENGWLVPAASVEPLAAAMKAAFTSPTAQLEQMGRRGRDSVLARHDIATEVAKLEAHMANGGQV